MIIFLAKIFRAKNPWENKHYAETRLRAAELWKIDSHQEACENSYKKMQLNYHDSIDKMLSKKWSQKNRSHKLPHEIFRRKNP